jgi:hypothetical protein
MKTPAQRVQEDIDEMIQGLLSFSEHEVKIREALAEAIVNALQALENFRETERLTRNTERLN